jgi:CzcA family heavy metal efflux pump
MLNRIILIALKQRMIVVALSLAVLVYGTYLSTTLPIDVFPDLDRPRVTIMTECVGLAPEEVETLVSFPLESALLGATGVQEVRSQSGPGLSVVYVEFGWETDIRVARQMVTERLQTIGDSLPEGAKPQMGPISSIMGQIVIMGLFRQVGPRGGELAPIEGRPGVVLERAAADALTAWRVTDRDKPSSWTEVTLGESNWLPVAANGSKFARVEIEGQESTVEFPTKERANLALRTLADWVVRPRLLRVPGTAQVIVMGGGRKQYQVLVEPLALEEFGVTLADVEKALRNNNVNASGGFADTDERERPIRVLGRLGPLPAQVLKDLAAIPVKHNDKRPILLGQVARIVEGTQVKRGDGSVSGRPGVVMTITKQPHVDTRAVTDRLEVAARELQPSLPLDVSIDTRLYQMRSFIDRGIFNVGEALVIGAFLVLVILFIFLFNLRTTFISLSAIPLSLVLTAVVFKLVGKLTGTDLSINVMTLGGIAVAMGELVDDAIVDVENIHRRLGQNAALPKPLPVLRVIYQASVEIRSAIVFGTILVVLVFLPLFALSGIQGRMFTPLGIAYIVSILASLFVSMTVTPAMSYYLLKNTGSGGSHGDTPVVRFLKRLAAPLIRMSMAIPGTLLMLTWAMVALAAFMATQMGFNFLPAFDEGVAQINIALPPGSSLEASNRATGLVDERLARLRVSDENPKGELLSFVRRSGRAELDEHAEPPNLTEYIVTTNPNSGKSRDAIIEQLREDLRKEVPGADVEVEQPLAHLISHMISGVTAQIAVKIVGDDLAILERLANEVKNAASGIPGVTPPVVEPLRQIEEIHVRLRPEQLSFYGVDRAYVAEFVQAALLGEPVSIVVEGQRRFDLILRVEEPYRRDPSQFGRLRVDLPDGKGQVPLAELADVGPGTGANQIKRESARRRIVVRCNAEGRDLQSVVTDLEAAIRADVAMPEGYHVEFAGQFEAAREATFVLTILSAVSGVGMFLVLYLLFPSSRVVLQILHAIPVAFIGGVLALVLTGQSLSVASLVGFISLGGIAARNGILLVTHYLHLMKHEGEEFSKKMILRGSLERLSPVLMTALTAGIGLVPLVVAGQEPGREILYPVATVILGGLVTSTFCEFFVRPGLFWAFSGKDIPNLVATSGEHHDDLDHDERPT